jgi:ribonuclease VapC
VTVVFDAEPLLAFAFDEPGAGAVQGWLDQVYDGELDGYAATINLAEFRYVAARKTSAERADSHLDTLRDMGVTEYGVDDLWRVAANLKTTHSLPLGDAYAVAVAADLDTERDVTLLVGADDDYDALENHERYRGLVERFRDEPA